MMRSCFVMVALLSVNQFSAKSHAQYITGPVSSAAGGAGLAANDEGEQVFMNPAALVHSKKFAIGYFYSDGYRATGEHDKWFGVTISDNSDDVAFAGGITYAQRRRTFANMNTRDERYIELSVAKSLGHQISLGVGVFRFDHELMGGGDYDQVDGRLGLFYNPQPDLGIGFIANNLGKRDTSLPQELQLKDELGIGVNYLFMPQFRGRADLYRQMELNPDEDFRWGVGIESLFDAFFIARFGFQNDHLADRKYYTLGFGFTGPRLKIDYSYVKNVDDHRGGMHSVDFRLPL